MNDIYSAGDTRNIVREKNSDIRRLENKIDILQKENEQLRTILRRHYKKSGICPFCGISKPGKHADGCEFSDLMEGGKEVDGKV